MNKIECFIEWLHSEIINKIDQQQTEKMDSYSELKYYIQNHYDTKRRIKYASKTAYRNHAKRMARLTNQ